MSHEQLHIAWHLARAGRVQSQVQGHQQRQRQRQRQQRLQMLFMGASECNLLWSTNRHTNREREIIRESETDKVRATESERETRGSDKDGRVFCPKNKQDGKQVD